MPFLAPFLRTTILLSTLTLAAAYALYENNPAFRSFVDKAVDNILAAWDHVLATLSPEERQRQREAQRREVLISLTSAGHPNAPSVPERQTAEASGADGPENDEGRLRRRRLWEMAERNAANLQQRLAAPHDQVPEASSNSRQQDPELQDSYATAATAPDPPESSIADLGVGTALSQAALESQDNARGLPKASSSTSLSGTSTASMDSYSNILTPPSPSLRSVSEADADADYGFESAQEVPVDSTAGTRSRTASFASASTETRSRFTQSAPASSVADDDVISLADTDDMLSVADSDMDVDEDDPSSAAAWGDVRRGAGGAGVELGRRTS